MKSCTAESKDQYDQLDQFLQAVKKTASVYRSMDICRKA